MAHIDPAAVEAAFTGILAAETGVSMALGKKSAAPAAPTPVNVTVNGISRDDFLVGMLSLAGAMLVLAAAVLVHAAVLHHGLTA